MLALPLQGAAGWPAATNERVGVCLAWELADGPFWQVVGLCARSAAAGWLHRFLLLRSDWVSLANCPAVGAGSRCVWGGVRVCWGVGGWGCQSGSVCSQIPCSVHLSSMLPCSRCCCRFKVERYMQLVFGLSSLLLFVPVLYNRTEQGGNKSREG